MPGKGWRKAPDGTWTPPNQMVHTIQIEEDTRDWLEDQIDGLKRAFLIGKASRAAGEGIKGLVSHPAGLVTLLSALGIGFLLLSPEVREALKRGAGIPGQALDTWWSTFIAPTLTATGIRPEDIPKVKDEFVRSLWNFMKGLTPVL